VLTFDPIGLEAIDRELIDLIQQRHYHPEEARMLPQGAGWPISEMIVTGDSFWIGHLPWS